MADKPIKLEFNRGHVAEGLLGAALVSKFINRPKSLTKDANVVVTKKMINDVLNDFFKKNTTLDYKVKDIVAKKGKYAVDEIVFSLVLPKKEYELLKVPKHREYVDDLYDSAIDYVEKTWKKDVLEFAANGVFDKIIISSEGTKDQKGTKVDIRITANGKPYRRQISLKVAGGDQFAQVSGPEFSKQKALWENVLNLDIKSLQESYDEALIEFDSSAAFSKREDKRVEVFRVMLKNAAAITYKEAALQIQKKINSNDDIFFKNLTELILYGATKGEGGVELVKLAKRTFKQVKFDKNFLKKFSEKLKNSNIKVDFRETGDPLVRIYIDTAVAKNIIIQIRTKVAAESSNLKSGKIYRPYLRNIIESGPKLFELQENL
jgi:hypothetical protein